MFTQTFLVSLRLNFWWFYFTNQWPKKIYKNCTPTGRFTFPFVFYKNFAPLGLNTKPHIKQRIINYSGNLYCRLSAPKTG